MRRTILVVSLCLYGVIFSWTDMLQAGDKEDMEAMQKQLNQNVLERPFNPGDKASIMAYLEQALQKGTLPPQLHPPTGWQPGWTCSKLMYSYAQYRNCLHYHQYYGHYYGY